MFRSLEILGFRGFSTKQALRLATPDGVKSGSGLTVIVGSNNAGKSTAIEALRALAQRDLPSFAQGRRNERAGDSVVLTLRSDEGFATLQSVSSGTSETTRHGDLWKTDLHKRIFVLPSRRAFNPHFHKMESSRDDYMPNMGFPAIRASAVEMFSARLFSIQKNREAFNKVLGRVLDPVPNWSIDQMDSGQFFLKIKKDGASHSSEGMGEGLVSLFFIVDALYDSKDGDLVAIDEPELSLHPALQRRLAELLVEFSTTRQIVIATHSPYFTNIEALASGATIARVHMSEQGSVVSQLDAKTGIGLEGLLRNTNNPHILGTNAKEIFFVEDRILLTEGQEDVVYLERVQASVEQRLNGTVYGWGVGSAENMPKLVGVLRELGYKRVVGILDADRAQLAVKLNVDFPGYHFFSIAADDIRTKPPGKVSAGKKGLLDEKNQEVREEYRADTMAKFAVANAYLESF